MRILWTAGKSLVTGASWRRVTRSMGPTQSIRFFAAPTWCVSTNKKLIARPVNNPTIWWNLKFKISKKNFKNLKLKKTSIEEEKVKITEGENVLGMVTWRWYQRMIKQLIFFLSTQKNRLQDKEEAAGESSDLIIWIYVGNERIKNKIQKTKKWFRL